MTEQGVAQQVLHELARDVLNSKDGGLETATARRCTWELTGAIMLHNRLSAEARAIYELYTKEITSVDDPEVRVVLSQKRDAVADAVVRLGLIDHDETEGE